MSGSKRGPGVTEAGHAAAIAAREARLAREAKAEAEVQRIFEDAIDRGLDTTPQAIRQALVETKERKAAERRARQAEAARRALALSEDEAPEPPEAYWPLPKIEAERRRLANLGEAHGYDALEKATGVGRTTIARRYQGQPPPGAAIPGICDVVKKHPHWEGGGSRR